MANPEPIPVTATHDLHQRRPRTSEERSKTVPAGTPGEITAATGSAPTYYTASFWLAGSNERVTVDHLTRFDLHEA